MTKTITKAKQLLRNLDIALQALAELRVDDSRDGSEPESEHDTDDSSDGSESESEYDTDDSSDGSEPESDDTGEDDSSDDDWNDTASVHDSDDESANYASESDSDSDTSSAGDLAAATRTRIGRTFFRNETFVPGSGWSKRPGYDGTDHDF